MSVDVTTEVMIDRPRDGVAAFAGDPGNAPRWYTNIKSVEWRTPPPIRVGSQLDFVAKFLGRTLIYTYEVAELVPGTRLVMRTSSGSFPMETTYAWESRGPTATKMTLRNRGEPSGFSGMAAPFLAGAMRRANVKDLARLKQLMESTS